MSWANPDAWNYVVAVITGGLLYGREVKIPAWLKRDRKRGPRRSPILPHPQRDAVAQRLSNGQTYNQIARDLLISPTTVAGHVAGRPVVSNEQELLFVSFVSFVHFVVPLSRSSQRGVFRSFLRRTAAASSGRFSASRQRA